jgi:hypothetical protein
MFFGVPGGTMKQNFLFLLSEIRAWFEGKRHEKKAVLVKMPFRKRG